MSSGIGKKKPIDAIRDALDETGIQLTGIVAEPMIWLTDPTNHAAFLDGLERSAECANRLGARVLITQAGDLRPGVPADQQRAALTECMARSADVLKGSGVCLALEPLNTLVDHPGYYLHSTTEALDIIDDVDRPEIRITYDIYHSMVMGEVPAEVIEGRIDRIAHVHIADHPGRNEPGSGHLPLRDAVGTLIDGGYGGWFGLEFRPTGSSLEGLAAAERALL